MNVYTYILALALITTAPMAYAQESVKTNQYTAPTPAGMGGALPVSSCMPPGRPSSGGKDGLPCQVTQGLVSGQFVTGTCQAGFCKANTFSSVVNAMGQQLTQRFVQQLTQGLFGGDDAEYPSYDPFGATDESILGDSLFDDPINDDPISWPFLFGDDVENTPATPLEYDPEPAVTVTVGTNERKPPTITQRLYATPQADTSGTVTPLPGRTEFERDFIATTLNTDKDAVYGRTLSIADLEKAAAEARRRESGVGIGEDTSGLRDYRSSNISRSNELRYEEEEEQKAPWWAAVVAFIGSLFGITNNSTE